MEKWIFRNNSGSIFRSKTENVFQGDMVHSDCFINFTGKGYDCKRTKYGFGEWREQSKFKNKCIALNYDKMGRN